MINSDSYPIHHFVVEEGRVHGGDEHGEADEEEAEDGHELAQVDEQARDDDRPGAEHVVELEEVEDFAPCPRGRTKPTSGSCSMKYSNKNNCQANIWFLNTDITDLEILVTGT